MYTLQQITNWTPEQLKNDSSLLNVINNLYTDGRADIRNHLLNDQDFQQTVKTQLEKVGREGYAISVDAVRQAERDIQAGRPINQKSAQEIEQANKFYSQMGIDPSSVPIFQQIKQGSVPDTYGGKVESAIPSTQVLASDSGQQGSNGVGGVQQVSRDANDNFFIDGKPVKLKADLASTSGAYPIAWEDLGLNADFVPRGTTVSLNQAKTGQIDTSGTSSQPGAVSGATGGISSSIDFTKSDWYKAFGVSDDMWNKLDDSTKAFVQSSAQLVQGQFDQGLINVSINSDLLNKALVSAQTDPNILAKYGDALKMNQAGLQSTLASIDADYAQSTGLTQAKQEAERKALAESQSEAGRAYSGYRQRAEQQLAQEQTGVIASSKRELQNKLTQLGSTLESHYGTSGLGQFAPIQAGGLAYTPTGDITGTIKGQRQADIEARQSQIFQREKLT